MESVMVGRSDQVKVKLPSIRSYRRPDAVCLKIGGVCQRGARAWTSWRMGVSGRGDKDYGRPGAGPVVRGRVCHFVSFAGGGSPDRR
jgi:hypothetical protein